MMVGTYWRFVSAAVLIVLVAAACTTPKDGGRDPESGPQPPVPVAVIELLPGSGTATAPVTVQLDGSASTGEIVAYTWHLDGTEISTQITSEHVLNEPGEFTFSLTVTDAGGRSATTTAAYLVLATEEDEDGGGGEPEPDPDPDPVDPPTASIQASPGSGSTPAPITVSFSGSASTGAIASYAWFVDGTPAGAGQTMPYTFTAAGTFTIRLEVTDERDRQDSAQLEYVVPREVLPGESHELTPDEFGGFQISIAPAGAWTATTGAAWLNVVPSSGAGGATTVDVSVDPALLPISGGSFDASLVFTDTAGSRTDTVTVLLPELGPLAPIHQGGLTAGFPHFFSIDPTNVGAHVLRVRFLVEGSGDVSVAPNLDGTLTIDPGREFEEGLVVNCPAGNADFAGTLRAETNDPRRPSVSVPVSFGCVEASPGDGYNITLVFQPGTFTAEQQAMIRAAADRWEGLIAGNIPNATTLPPYYRESCLRWQSWNEAIVPPELRNVGWFDGLLVTVTAAQPGETALALAGPCWTPNPFPNFGRIWVNMNRLDMMTTTNSLETVMIHELGHVLGIGTIWLDEHRNLIRPIPNNCGNPSLPSTFAGQAGVSEYQALGGTNQPPLDELCHHWSEERFHTEALTPYITIDPGGNNHDPLSRMTLGALQDLGYQVNYSAADPYTLPAPGLQPHAPREGAETFRYADPLIYIVDEQGRTD